MFISDVAIKRPVITIVSMLILVVFGIVALTQLDTDEFPDVQPPVVAVAVPPVVPVAVVPPVVAAIPPVPVVLSVPPVAATEPPVVAPMTPPVLATTPPEDAPPCAVVAVPPVTLALPPVEAPPVSPLAQPAGKTEMPIKPTKIGARKTLRAIIGKRSGAQRPIKIT